MGTTAARTTGADSKQTRRKHKTGNKQRSKSKPGVRTRAEPSRNKKTLGAAAKRRGASSLGRDTYHHGNLRVALISAAAELIRTGNVHALTLRKAAKHAGVSEAAPYRHFANKEALLAAVAQQGFAALAEDQTAVFEANQGLDAPAECVRELALAYIDFALGHPARYQLMFGPDVADHTAHPALVATTEEAFRPMRQATDACVARLASGGSSPRAAKRAGVDAKGAKDSKDGGNSDSYGNEATKGLWALVHGLASLFMSGAVGRGNRLNLLDTANDIVDVWLLGLRARATTQAARSATLESLQSGSKGARLSVVADVK